MRTVDGYIYPGTSILAPCIEFSDREVVKQDGDMYVRSEMWGSLWWWWKELEGDGDGNGNGTSEIGLARYEGEE